MAAAKTDSSRDARLNPVHRPDGTVVSWAEAFPRETPITVPVECDCAACEAVAA